MGAVGGRRRRRQSKEATCGENPRSMDCARGQALGPGIVMTSRDSTETERKYDADPSSGLQEWTAIPGIDQVGDTSETLLEAALKTRDSVYWGDMDRDGYEILDGYRADFGRDIDSILMGPEAYEAYEPFGTELDRTGKVLQPGNPRPVVRLRSEERSLYLRLLDPQHTGHRRVEQERIPLARALEEVELIGRRFDRCEIFGP